jgi:S-adenosylmethionine hydrolase
MRPVTFLSDYGLQDEFAAVCKGIIWQLAPGTPILDITHGIAPGNIRSGALTLARAIQYVPVGVHLAVVDPGVGTDRAALAVEAADGRFFIGPDNGLLSPAVQICGGASAAVRLDPERWGMTDPSPTFAGRDVFAPAAGALAVGADLGDLGDTADPAGLTALLLPLCQVEAGIVRGVVLWVDRYGNVSTNITEADLTDAGIGGGDAILISTAIAGRTRRERVPFVRTFADVETGRLLAFVDSAGQLAIAVNGGDAASELGIGEGATITAEPSPALL